MRKAKAGSSPALLCQHRLPHCSCCRTRKRTYMQNVSDNATFYGSFDTTASLFDDGLSNDSFSAVVSMGNNLDTSTEAALLGTVTGNSSFPQYELKHPIIGVVLASFCLVVVVGNVMVIVAVAREMYLRTATNYLIVSLAIADVMVGGIVMPFSISNEMTNNTWLYGTTWCDLWHSIDVLASTASILNLCVISLDRYWAITDPIAYPTTMSNHKVCLLIASVWACSSGISFPAIAWWRSVNTPVVPDYQCEFTTDSAYLIISSVVSFYIPTIIMMFVYAKIYRAAMAQTEGIKTGSKVTADCPRGDDGELMTLRIHRGGYRLRNEPISPPTNNDCHHSHQNHSSEDSENESPLNSTRHHVYNSNNRLHQPRSTTFISKKIRHFAISKKITKLAREQKAAKTLGIVVGVFIICWLPFFCTNVLLGICPEDCVQDPKLVMIVFTWLGYVNSGMNPIIYALSMRDFRRAFSKMIFCCPRYRYTHTKKQQYKQTNSLSTSSFSVACDRTCVPMRI